MIGGGVRVPKVQSVLRERLGSKLDLSMHLNGDEAMAQGASFYAANISTRFKVRPSVCVFVRPYVHLCVSGLACPSLFIHPIPLHPFPFISNPTS